MAAATLLTLLAAAALTYFGAGKVGQLPLKQQAQAVFHSLMFPEQVRPQPSALQAQDCLAATLQTLALNTADFVYCG